MFIFLLLTVSLDVDFYGETPKPEPPSFRDLWECCKYEKAPFVVVADGSVLPKNVNSFRLVRNRYAGAWREYFDKVFARDTVYIVYHKNGRVEATTAKGDGWEIKVINGEVRSFITRNQRQRSTISGGRYRIQNLCPT